MCLWNLALELIGFLGSCTHSLLFIKCRASCMLGKFSATLRYFRPGRVETRRDTHECWLHGQTTSRKQSVRLPPLVPFPSSALFLYLQAAGSPATCQLLTLCPLWLVAGFCPISTAHGSFLLHGVSLQLFGISIPRHANWSSFYPPLSPASPNSSTLSMQLWTRQFYLGSLSFSPSLGHRPPPLMIY